MRARTVVLAALAATLADVTGCSATDDAGTRSAGGLGAAPACAG